MSYIEQSLAKGESIYKKFEHHWFIKVALVFHFTLGLLTAGLWLIPAIYFWLSWRSMEQGVTNKRVIFKQGIISRKTDEMRLNAIEAIEIQQGILGRIFNFGSVRVTGRGLGDVVIKWIADPMEVKRNIENADYVDPVSSPASQELETA